MSNYENGTEKRIDELTESLRKADYGEKPTIEYRVVNSSDLSLEEVLKISGQRMERLRRRLRGPLPFRKVKKF
jgi:hypothetical protein